MSRSLVTGASGFIGKNLVQTLREAGEDVVCLVHSQTAAAALRQQGLTAFAGDLRDADCIGDAWEGVDTVYHLASTVAPHSREATFAVNVEGTRRLAEAASRRAQPPTFVHISSLSAAGPSRGEQPRREEDADHPVSWYGESKLAAEEALIQLADRLPVTVVRPPSVFGFGDTNLLAMYKTVRRRWNLIGVSKRFRYSFLHVSDLVNGLIAAARQGHRLAPNAARDRQRAGVYYLCDERHVTFEELGEVVADAVGVSGVRHVCLPAILCWPLAAVGGWYGHWRRKKTFFNLDKMREAAAGSWVCSSDRARDELGFAPAMSLAERVRETERWYSALGWLTASDTSTSAKTSPPVTEPPCDSAP